MAAHIANLMVDMDAGSISKVPLSSSVTSSPMKSSPVGAVDKPFTWRMQQQPPPEQQRKYQLFPKERQLPALNSGKNLDPEKAFAYAMNHNGEKTEKPAAASGGLRIRINAPILGRRRKISIQEPGPMTTVQEVAMDSPTIPGRPPLHERSASAPGISSKHPRINETSFLTTGSLDWDEDFNLAIEESFGPNPATPGKPLSPRDLAPLVIPQTISQAPRLISKRSYTHVRSGSLASETLRNRMDDSPMGRNLQTPSTSATDLTTPKSAGTTVNTTATNTTIPTPVSAPIMEAHRASPKPWDIRSATPLGNERSNTPLNDDSQRIANVRGHRRGASESSSMSIMDRGRPRKRSEPRRTDVIFSKGDSKPPKSAERRAFEELPKGWKPSEVADHLSSQELLTLQRQAFNQVARFEILRPEDVENLSKELRSLDERTDYLRRTYTSLRAGRRNLHGRICQYLRSPRVAKFSHDSMLKQEEALAELDSSIDDWVTKLEMAENRRTRVRQKLLEHVAAAALLPTGDSSSAVSELSHHSTPAVHNMSTPPRSPSKQTFPPAQTSSGSPSPQRVVAQVPSTILEHPIVEESAALDGQDRVASLASMRRSDAESIRIYAGNDIYLYSLLADVESEISKMGTNSQEAISQEALETKRKELHRQRSHEMLSGLADSTTTTTKLSLPQKDANSTVPLSPPAPTPPLKDEFAQGPTLLTNAVFKP